MIYTQWADLRAICKNVYKCTSDTLGLNEINIRRTMITLTKSLGLFMAFSAFSHPEEQIPHH